jgi:hypothetical protein
MRDAGARLRATEGAVTELDPVAEHLPVLIRPVLDAVQAASDLASASPRRAAAHLLLARASITEALNSISILRAQ